MGANFKTLATRFRASQVNQACRICMLLLATQIARADGPAGAVSIEFEPARKWTNAWNISTEATLVGFQGASVELKTEEGTLVVPIATLANDDVSYLKTTLKKLGKEDCFPGQATPDGTEKIRQPPGDWKHTIESWEEIVVQDTPVVSVAAWNRIRNIRDPAALSVLLKRLDEAEHAGFAIACVEAIASIASEDAVRALVTLSVEDERYAVSNIATWMIKTIDISEAMFDEFARLLKTKKHQESAMMNVFVADVANPKRSSADRYLPRNSRFTKSLVSLLTITQSKPAWIGNWKASWSRSGTSARGHLKIKTASTRVFFEVAYPTALQLLKQYTGEDYGYRKREWYRWEKSSAEKRSD